MPLQMVLASAKYPNSLDTPAKPPPKYICMQTNKNQPVPFYVLHKIAIKLYVVFTSSIVLIISLRDPL
jgi:hypothetical protein